MHNTKTGLPVCECKLDVDVVIENMITNDVKIDTKKPIAQWSSGGEKIFVRGRVKSSSMIATFFIRWVAPNIGKWNGFFSKGMSEYGTGREEKFSYLPIVK
jgi:hypothetical protein